MRALHEISASLATMLASSASDCIPLNVPHVAGLIGEALAVLAEQPAAPDVGDLAARLAQVEKLLVEAGLAPAPTPAPTPAHAPAPASTVTG